MQRALLRAINNHYYQTHKLLPPFLFSTLPTISLNPNYTNYTPKRIELCKVCQTFEPNMHTLEEMIRNCTTKNDIFLAKQLHCYVLRSGYSSNVFVSSSLVTFYAKMVSMEDARQVFDEMPQRSVATWNSMISGFVHTGKLYNALYFFLDLVRSNVRPNLYSFSLGLVGCGQLSLLKLGMSIHTRIVICALESNVVVANCLIDMYGKCGLLDGATRVFDELVDKDVISWNSIIAASVRNRNIELAYAYFNHMPCPDTISYNELITGVAQFGNIDDAIEILRNMPQPNSSSWNAIISGYVFRNSHWEALKFFSEMHANGIIVDHYTLLSVLRGISRLSDLKWGSSLHGFTIKHGMVTFINIGSALIDMYSKCGQVKHAELLFHSLPCRNIVTWNTMISGFAHNGESNKVIQYFEELKSVKGIKPDDITFVNLLAACSHNNIPLHKAHEYFTCMIDEYNLEPKVAHLTSLIRLMGHYGEVSHAEKVICELGLDTSGRVWRALLSACVTCGNFEVAKVAAAKVIEFGDNDEFGYVALSNMNKSNGDWVDAAMVWNMMKKKSVVKEAGFSWIGGGYLAK